MAVAKPLSGEQFVGAKVVAKPLLVGRRWLCQVVERGGVCRGEGACQAVVAGAKVAVAKLLSGLVFVGAKVALLSCCCWCEGSFVKSLSG